MLEETLLAFFEVFSIEMETGELPEGCRSI
jgi:hypothetical protein